MATASKEKAQVNLLRRTLLATAMPAVWLDPRGRIVEINGAARELLGADDGSLHGRSAMALVETEDRHEIVSFLVDANAARAGMLRREVRLLAGHGPTAVDLGLTFIDDAEDPGVLLQLYDLSDHRLAERALDHSEQRYRRFFEDHTVAMYRTRRSGEIVEANQAMAELAGYPHPRYLLSVNAASLYVRETDREALCAELDRAGSVAGRDFELVRHDGSTIWVRDFSEAVEQPDGSVIYEGALFDVTERYRAQAELQNRALQQAAVAGLGQLALQSSDAHAVAISACRMAQEVLGMAGVLLLRGRDLATFARWDGTETAGSPLDRVDADWALAQVADLGQPVLRADPGTGDRFLVTPVPDVDGTLAVLVSAAPPEMELSDDDLHFAQAVAAVIAATLERADSRARLEQLVSSKDEFIASISHEVRTPLTVVMGIAHELQERWREVEEKERSALLDLIVEQTQEMTNLVEDLLVAARADIGKLPIHVEAMETGPAIKSVVDAVGAPHGVGVELSPHSPMCYADPVRFRQIMRNLLTNAYRYGGDEVKITVTHDEDRVWVEVVDNGAGVEVEARDAIFEPYERAHRLSGQPGSVGLGLTVSRRLARLMNGDLTYRFDDASVFTLELAAAPRLMFWNESDGARRR